MLALPSNSPVESLISDVMIFGGVSVAQMVKNLPATKKTQFQSLGWEDSLKKEMVIHSSILAWRIPWTEEPGGLQSMVSQRVGRLNRLGTHIHCFKPLYVSYDNWS